MKYSFSFKNHSVTPVNLLSPQGQESIIRRCQERGTKQQVEFDGKTYQISYNYVMIDDKEYWLFSNDEPKVTFDGTFRMKLTNLIDESGRPECDWAIKLGPG
jgi:hypothetical protein